ncbi:MAG: BNR-4 repeat-containing protein [Candidatus Hydrogenedentota bacterium]
MRTALSVFTLLTILFIASPASGTGEAYFAWDSIGGTLARDHQSRAMYHEGKHRRTYVAYMDHSFFARITYYDHDKEEWLYPPVLLDDCIRPDDRFHRAYKDGHNVPNLFITRDGTIHIFYGAHGTVFRYARTKSPENVLPGNWELDMRVGAEGTYPFFSETADGALHVFYRYSPTGGYKNPFLGLQTTGDNGETWSDIQKLATFPDACKLYRGAYDPVRNRVHLLLHPRGPLGGRHGAVHCIYDPGTEELVSLAGDTMGPMGNLETFQEGLPKIFHGLVDFVLHDGMPYFLYERKGERFDFGYWADGAWVELPDTENNLKGLASRPVMYTADGVHFKVFAVADLATKNENLTGGVIKVWESADRGKTWSAGEVVAGREEFGHGFQEINKVMQYAGDGPFFIAAEPTGPWPDGWEKTQYTHYDNPSRRDKKLYAFDVDGNLIAGEVE